MGTMSKNYVDLYNCSLLLQPLGIESLQRASLRFLAFLRDGSNHILPPGSITKSLASAVLPCHAQFW